MVDHVARASYLASVSKALGQQLNLGTHNLERGSNDNLTRENKNIFGASDEFLLASTNNGDL